MQKLAGYNGDPLTRLGLQLIIHMMVRTTELREATWDEFNLDKKEWRIPAERMKMKEMHIVPLTEPVIALLEELQQHSGHGSYLFPHVNDPTKVMSNNTMLFALYRMGYKGRATTHGFRATASTILNEHGHRPDVIERQLAHAERNKVRKAYNHAEYMPERKAMMQWWSEYLEKTSHA